MKSYNLSDEQVLYTKGIIERTYDSNDSFAVEARSIKIYILEKLSINSINTCYDPIGRKLKINYFSDCDFYDQETVDRIKSLDFSKIGINNLKIEVEHTK